MSSQQDTTKTKMKKQVFLLLLLLCCFYFSQAQNGKVESDTLIVRNDSVFVVKKELNYVLLADTAELHARIIEIEGIIEVFNAEKEKPKEQISFFQASKAEMIRNTKRPVPSKKKPANSNTKP